MCSFVFKLSKKTRQTCKDFLCSERTLVRSQPAPIFNYLIYRNKRRKEARNKKQQKEMIL